MVRTILYPATNLSLIWENLRKYYYFNITNAKEVDTDTFQTKLITKQILNMELPTHLNKSVNNKLNTWHTAGANFTATNPPMYYIDGGN